MFGGNELASLTTNVAHLTKKLSLEIKIPNAGGQLGILLSFFGWDGYLTLLKAAEDFERGMPRR